MAEELVVTCKGCYAPFPLPEDVDPEALSATRLRCPTCGISRPYDPGDVRAADDPESATPGLGGFGLGDPGAGGPGPWPGR